MKTTNLFKALALAALTVVSSFNVEALAQDTNFITNCAGHELHHQRRSGKQPCSGENHLQAGRKLPVQPHALRIYLR